MTLRVNRQVLGWMVPSRMILGWFLLWQSRAHAEFGERDYPHSVQNTKNGGGHHSNTIVHDETHEQYNNYDKVGNYNIHDINEDYDNTPFKDDTIFNTDTKTTRDPRFQIHPPLDPTNIVDNWIIKGSSVPTPPQKITLNPETIDRIGLLWNRQELRSSDFQLTVTLNITKDLIPGQGIGIWVEESLYPYTSRSQEEIKLDASDLVWEAKRKAADEYNEFLRDDHDNEDPYNEDYNEEEDYDEDGYDLHRDEYNHDNHDDDHAISFLQNSGQKNIANQEEVRHSKRLVGFNGRTEVATRRTEVASSIGTNRDIMHRDIIITRRRNRGTIPRQGIPNSRKPDSKIQKTKTNAKKNANKKDVKKNNSRRTGKVKAALSKVERLNPFNNGDDHVIGISFLESAHHADHHEDHDWRDRFGGADSTLEQHLHDHDHHDNSHDDNHDSDSSMNQREKRKLSKRAKRRRALQRREKRRERELRRQKHLHFDEEKEASSNRDEEYKKNHHDESGEESNRTKYPDEMEKHEWEQYLEPESNSYLTPTRDWKSVAATEGISMDGYSWFKPLLPKNRQAHEDDPDYYDYHNPDDEGDNVLMPTKLDENGMNISPRLDFGSKLLDMEAKLFETQQVQKRDKASTVSDSTVSDTDTVIEAHDYSSEWYSEGYNLYGFKPQFHGVGIIIRHNPDYVGQDYAYNFPEFHNSKKSHIPTPNLNRTEILCVYSLNDDGGQSRFEGEMTHYGVHEGTHHYSSPHKEHNLIYTKAHSIPRLTKAPHEIMLDVHPDNVMVTITEKKTTNDVLHPTHPTKDEPATKTICTIPKLNFRRSRFGITSYTGSHPGIHRHGEGQGHHDHSDHHYMKPERHYDTETDSYTRKIPEHDYRIPYHSEKPAAVFINKIDLLNHDFTHLDEDVRDDDLKKEVKDLEKVNSDLNQHWSGDKAHGHYTNIKWHKIHNGEALQTIVHALDVYKNSTTSGMGGLRRINKMLADLDAQVKTLHTHLQDMYSVFSRKAHSEIEFFYSTRGIKRVLAMQPDHVTEIGHSMVRTAATNRKHKYMEHDKDSQQYDSHQQHDHAHNQARESIHKLAHHLRTEQKTQQHMQIFMVCILLVVLVTLYLKVRAFERRQSYQFPM